MPALPARETRGRVSAATAAFGTSSGSAATPAAPRTNCRRENVGFVSCVSSVLGDIQPSFSRTSWYRPTWSRPTTLEIVVCSVKKRHGGSQIGAGGPTELGAQVVRRSAWEGRVDERGNGVKCLGTALFCGARLTRGLQDRLKLADVHTCERMICLGGCGGTLGSSIVAPIGRSRSISGVPDSNPAPSCPAYGGSERG